MTNYSLLGFALSKRRKAILLCLDKPKTPKEIALGCKVSIHNISKSLGELSDKGLVQCKNKEAKFFRFYGLTKKGKEIVREMSKQ